MSANAPFPPPVDVWQVQHLKMISFPAEPQVDAVQNWWQQLTGEERENRIQKKREIREDGVYQGLDLDLSIDLLRIQWTVSPRVDPAAISETIPTSGLFRDKQESFRALMRRWFPMSPPIKRLSFAGLLLQPVQSRQDGYQLLDRYLHSVEVDPESTDFLYRINRRMPIRTGVPGLVANRLTTWSVGQFNVVIRAQIAGVEPNPTNQTIREHQYACIVELDINTVPEPAERILPHQSLSDIFDELVAIGMDVAANGDRRR